MSVPGRLAVVIHALHGGGAERMAALLANHWAGRGRTVTVVTLGEAHGDTYGLAPDINRTGLGLVGHSPTPLHGLWNNWRRLRALREAIRQARPGVVVSHCLETNVLVLLATRRLGCPVVITEHTSLADHRVGPLWRWLRRRTYPRCAGLVVLNEAWRESAGQLVGHRPVWVIPNAVRPPRHRRSPGAPGPPGGQRRPFRVISMGRLAPEKGFDMLLAAFAQVARDRPHCQLRILGDGPERPRLQRQIQRLRLAGQVHLAGWVADPERQLVEADLYVLSSRYEGSPVALQEAMACGLPAVSFDCPGGARDVVRHEVDGLLVPPGDVEQLAAAIGELADDPDRRERLAARAAEVCQRFSLEEFFRRWDAALQMVAPS